MWMLCLVHLIGDTGPQVEHTWPKVWNSTTGMCSAHTSHPPAVYKTSLDVDKFIIIQWFS